MSDIKPIDTAMKPGVPVSAEALLPLVYAELRQLAAHRIAQEGPNFSLQGTALVHEAYLRLVDAEDVQRWDSRGHFFAAAAEAMRRILVERARKKRSLKRGGGRQRLELDLDCVDVTACDGDEKLLALDEALHSLEANDPQAHQLVMLRYFGGLGHQEAAAAMGISRRAADRIWAVARVWLFEQVSQNSVGYDW